MRTLAGPRARSRASLLRRLLTWLELQRRRIEAVAQTSRLRAVVEYMPQVRVTAIANNLGADHEQATILHLADYLVIDGLEETGPARARIEFGAGIE